MPFMTVTREPGVASATASDISGLHGSRTHRWSDLHPRVVRVIILVRPSCCNSGRRPRRRGPSLSVVHQFSRAFTSRLCGAQTVGVRRGHLAAMNRGMWCRSL
jgi:hypothetical protein